MVAMTGGAEIPSNHPISYGCGCVGYGGVVYGGGCVSYGGGVGYGGCVGYGCSGYYVGRHHHHRHHHINYGCGYVSHGCVGYGCGGVIYGGYSCGGVISGGCCGGIISGGCCGGVIIGGSCVGYSCGGVILGGGMGYQCCGGIIQGPIMGTPIVPDKMTPPDKTPPNKGDKGPEKIDFPSKEVSAPVPEPTPAKIVVTLPANAKLTFDGKDTLSTSEVRTFVSPALQPKRTFTYTLTAEITQNGAPVRQSQKISVRAGQETRVQFDFAPASVVTTNVSARP